MTPLELIRKGIETGDWQQVADGYERMTGESVDLPETPEIVTASGRTFSKDELKYLPINFKGRPNMFAQDDELVNSERDDLVKTKDGELKKWDEVLNPKKKRAHHSKRAPARYVTKKCRQCGASFKVVTTNKAGIADANVDIYCSRCSRGG